MAGDEIDVRIVGNLTANPELRFTPGGDAVANFSVASTERKQENGQWVDGDTSFTRVTVWRSLAENVAATLKQGSRVVVVGKLRQNNYEDKEGNKRQSWEVHAEDVGASLKFVQGNLTRVTQQGQQGAPQGQPQYQQGPPQQQFQQQPQYQQVPAQPQVQQYQQPQVPVQQPQVQQQYQQPPVPQQAVPVAPQGTPPAPGLGGDF